MNHFIVVNKFWLLAGFYLRNDYPKWVVKNKKRPYKNGPFETSQAVTTFLITDTACIMNSRKQQTLQIFGRRKIADPVIYYTLTFLISSVTVEQSLLDGTWSIRGIKDMVLLCFILFFFKVWKSVCKKFSKSK